MSLLLLPLLTSEIHQNRLETFMRRVIGKPVKFSNRVGSTIILAHAYDFLLRSFRSSGIQVLLAWHFV